MLAWDHKGTCEQSDVCYITCCCEGALMLAQRYTLHVYMHHFLCSAQWLSFCLQVFSNSLTSETGVFSGEQNEANSHKLFLSLFIRMWMFTAVCM